MKIYKNFLPKDIFKKLKNTMMGEYFPWYFNDYVSNFQKENNFQFTFRFINDGDYVCWGEWKNIIIPVLQKINHKKING